jgi:LAGLIDADG endonuclease
MPGLVGGFGNKNFYINILKKKISTFRNEELSDCQNKIEKELNISADAAVCPACPSIILILELRSKLGPYLAGLIESDGTIAVHDKNSKAKKYNPKIAVVFNLADEPLAYKLLNITKVGTILKKKKAGHIL